MGPGVADRVCAGRRVVAGAGAGAVAVLVRLVPGEVDVGPAPLARVRCPLPPPPQPGGGRLPRGGREARGRRAEGAGFPPLGQGFEMREEQLQILLGMWATPAGQRFAFEGKHYRVIDSPGLPKPVQKPQPPIIIGGAGSRRTPKLAARYADEFNVPFHGVADFTKSVGR